MLNCQDFFWNFQIRFTDWRNFNRGKMQNLWRQPFEDRQFLQIRTSSPFNKEAKISVDFYGPSARGDYRSGGLTLIFSTSGPHQFKVHDCSNLKNLNLFPNSLDAQKVYIDTQSYIWTMKYFKQSKKVLVTLNGVLILNFVRSSASCERATKFSYSNDVWDTRKKERLKFSPQDTISQNYRVCKVCAGTFSFFRSSVGWQTWNHKIHTWYYSDSDWFHFAERKF